MGKNVETAVSRKIIGTVGGQVFYEWRGMNLVRMKSSGKRTMTPEQMRQQVIFTALIDLAGIFGEAAATGFANRPRIQSPENAFVAANAGVITLNEEGTIVVDYPHIICSQGNLKAPKLTVTTGEDGTLLIEHPAEKNGYHRYEDDRLFVALLEEELMEVQVVELNQRKDADPVPVTLEKGWKQEKLHIYAFYRRAKGKQASKTEYVKLAE